MGVISIRFGTSEIREELPDAVAYKARRVYSDGNAVVCSHRHASGKAVIKCARSLAMGQRATWSWDSYVEIIDYEKGKNE